MKRWKPQFSPAVLITGLLALVLFGISSIPLRNLALVFVQPPEQWQLDVRLFGWFVLALILLIGGSFLIYRAAAALTLAYELDRNGLYISWLGNRAVVPLDQVSSLDVGTELKRTPLGVLQWLGSYWGRALTRDEQPVQMFATQPPMRTLLVHTPDLSYAISPADQEGFVQELEQRRNLGVTKPLSSAIEPGRIFLYAFWSDRYVQLLLILAIGLNLLALFLLSLSYGQLTPMIAMRFDPTGAVAEMQPRSSLLYIPLAAMGLGLGNTILGLILYTRQLLSARLLQGASVVVQIVCLLALLTILR